MKKQLHAAHQKVHTINPWYFFAVFIVFGSIWIVSMRNNNLHMAKLRDAVYAADERGSGVEEALQNLRGYVNTHMNTSLSTGNSGVYPPVQLKYTYERLVQAAGQQASSSNSQIYSDAQKTCEQQIPNGFSGRVRLDCITNYVEQHGVTQNSSIPDSLYKFDFASPWWSPDVAGFSLLATIISFALFVYVFLVHLLRHRRQQSQTQTDK
jgi:hypothetical protein